MTSPSARVIPILRVGLLTAVVSVLLAALHVPSAVLFGGLVGGIVEALTSPVELQLPSYVFRLAQGMVGVIIGSGITVSALSAMGDEAVPILLITLGTVAISLAAGRVFALRRDVSAPTGAFSLIAGGASGVVAIARDLGADDRVVTVVQYLRVLIVLVTLPLVTSVVFHPEHGVGALRSGPTELLPSLTYVALTLGLGMLIARLVPITTAILLGPIVVGATLITLPAFDHAAVPSLLQWLAYALIGAQVGLRFTRAALASIARMLPMVTVIIVVMIALTAGMGALLAWITPVDGLTAYLATTPGGLFAVLATAADAGADVTYVMAVQLVRLLVILALTPLLAAYLARKEW